MIAYNAYRQPAKAEPTPAPSIGLSFRVWGTFVLLAGYVLLMPINGFPLALLIFFVFFAGFGLVLPRGPF